MNQRCLQPDVVDGCAAAFLEGKGSQSITGSPFLFPEPEPCWFLTANLARAPSNSLLTAPSPAAPRAEQWPHEVLYALPGEVGMCKSCRLNDLAPGVDGIGNEVLSLASPSCQCWRNCYKPGADGSSMPGGLHEAVGLCPRLFPLPTSPGVPGISSQSVSTPKFIPVCAHP